MAYFLQQGDHERDNVADWQQRDWEYRRNISSGQDATRISATDSRRGEDKRLQLPSIQELFGSELSQRPRPVVGSDPSPFISSTQLHGPPIANTSRPTHSNPPQGYGQQGHTPVLPQRLAIPTPPTQYSIASYPRGMPSATVSDAGPLNYEPMTAHSSRYECEYCGKGFTRPSSLKIHIHSHTGERPYKCTFGGCERTFSLLPNMRRHARMHQHPNAADAKQMSGGN